MSHLMDEIASQPECWAKAIELAASAGAALPAAPEPWSSPPTPTR